MFGKDIKLRFKNTETNKCIANLEKKENQFQFLVQIINKVGSKMKVSSFPKQLLAST